MVVVPAGEFMMGSEETADEKPVHKVTIAKPFAVGRFEATFAEWDTCVSDGGCNYRPDDRGWGRDNRPVINVSWDEITKEYVPWLARKTGKTYRFPTEAEWEYAARAGSTAKYTWGNELGSNRANCDRCGSRWDRRQTAPVGSFEPNAFGLFDMHGNVWEWVADCRKDSYANASSNDNVAPGVTTCPRVLRGGSWVTDPGSMRAASRLGLTQGGRGFNYGFRLVRTLSP
jgi:formylglycine-generating enzyme required for sulfatase activity